MVVERVLGMNAGDGEYSYANNSLHQRRVLLNSRPHLVQTIKDMFITNHDLWSCFKMADLGCSSGSNTMMVISNVVDTINEICEKTNLISPEFNVFLNDLPENDFNTIFKRIPSFYETMKKRKNDEELGGCFIAGVAGSFYGRLFPTKSLHFVHSSYSVHWLSKVPDGIGNNNKNHIHIGKSSPLVVHKAYQDQFEKDFSSFLSLRSQEVITGGRMVLVFIGRSNTNLASEDSSYLWMLLTKSLLDFVVEGYVKASDLDSFNLPIYYAHKSEVKDIVEKEGSFKIDKMETFQVNWDGSADDDDFVSKKQEKNEKIIANMIRAVVEPMLVTHFEDNIDFNKLFKNYSTYIAQHLLQEKSTNILISMTKK